MRRLFFLLLILVLILPSCAADTLPAPAAFSVSIKTENFMDGACGVMLKYPVISGYTGAAAQSAMNEKIVSLVYEMYRKEIPVLEDGDGCSYAITDARVTFQSDVYLSVVIGGVVASGLSGNESGFSYTINCKIDDGTFYTAEEILADYPALVQFFKKGDFTQDFGHPGVTAQMDLCDLIGQYKAEYGILPDVYFSENGLGFLIEVIPLLDGYAGFTIPYGRAAKHLRADNPFAAYAVGS